MKAIILGDKWLNYDLIIGSDFLGQNHVGISKTKDTLNLFMLSNEVPQSVNMIEFDERKTLDINEINCGEILGEPKRKLFDLLKRYRKCIAFSLKEIGKTNVTEMQIKLMVDVPITYHPYRLANVEKQVLQKMINELLEHNIIRHSTSPYASPVLLVKKKRPMITECAWTIVN